MLMLISAMNYVKGLLRKEEGQGMVEYSLILAVIAVVALAAFHQLGWNVRDVANNVANNIHN
ncbi:MAG TPA: Flp family type IVb pilin [Negativicutes bacterium]|jgi:pilus assembly protein Flp/PilA